MLFTFDAFKDTASVASNAVVVVVIAINVSYIGLLFVRFCMEFKKRQQKKIDKVSKLAKKVSQSLSGSSKKDPEEKRPGPASTADEVKLQVVEMTPSVRAPQPDCPVRLALAAEAPHW